ncbi:hypothetical protein M911_13565 [Ectothiorhodospira haloalkaliphila]|uniref:Phasin domain-containing protein n=1 Tax=Ectothiorhodospira haloalkaliphila TaxID=421628 RepID=W8KLG0_9GAMM|nr:MULTISPECIES: phasin family protein [Ectothiorhodospira]AHK80008.1 hypothetical protein M911_13565 [Ectothiorhodospira haloalkaliphila]MCG5494480.1 phasin family protein [Ectothiorhodospira variabilis]MCG5498873.1 phasin family protein [Ectothiorhodospira variabilis]MCG5503149.1 phasin family protein [Ectothiorhodospira variabilis]MCG5506092.1 phasin family protein [Ectothiorhodospira variabilis]
MNEMFETFNKANQSMFDTLRKVNDINQKALEKLLSQQLDLTTAMVDVSMKNVELVSKAKGYQELLSGQADLARDCSQTLMTSYKNGHDVLNEARESMTKLMDESVKSAEETVKQATSIKKAA